MADVAESGTGRTSKEPTPEASGNSEQFAQGVLQFLDFRLCFVMLGDETLVPAQDVFQLPDVWHVGVCCFGGLMGVAASHVRKRWHMSLSHVTLLRRTIGCP